MYNVIFNDWIEGLVCTLYDFKFLLVSRAGKRDKFSTNICLASYVFN